MCVSAICSCKAGLYLTMNETLVRQVNDSERFDEVKYEGESVAHPGKVNSEWFAFFVHPSLNLLWSSIFKEVVRTFKNTMTLQFLLLQLLLVLVVDVVAGWRFLLVSRYNRNTSRR